MTASTSFRSTRPRRMPRTPVAIRAAGKDKNVMQARFRNIVRRMSTPTAIFFAVNPPPWPIASTRAARSEDRERSMSSTLRRSRSRFRIAAESWVRDKRIWSPTGPHHRSDRSLRLSDETAESLSHADRTAPSEGVAAITATAPPIVLEGDPSGSADVADARTRFLDSAVAAFVLDLRLESPRGLFRIPGEREAGEIVALRQDVLCLPEQRPDLRRVEVVRLGLLEDRFACDENRTSFLDLRLAKPDRPFDLLLLALHREPFGPLEQVARMTMLARGDRLSGRGMKLLGLSHLCADVSGEFGRRPRAGRPPGSSPVPPGDDPGPGSRPRASTRPRRERSTHRGSRPRESRPSSGPDGPGSVPPPGSGHPPTRGRDLGARRRRSMNRGTTPRGPFPGDRVQWPPPGPRDRTARGGLVRPGSRTTTRRGEAVPSCAPRCETPLGQR